MKKILLLLVFLLGLTSCDLNNDEEHVIGIVKSEFIKDLKQKGLTPFMTGGGLGKNFEIAVGFECFQKVNISDARKLGVGCALAMLKKYNTNKKFREKTPYYPLNIRDIVILIGFRNEDGKSMKSGYVANMGVSRNKIYYTYCDEKTEKLIKFHEESFEEALRIVEAEKASNKNSL